MSIIIALGRMCLSFLYFFMKLVPVRNRVCMLSRESDSVPLDFRMLENQLKKSDSSLEIVYVCEFIDTKNAGAIRILKNTLRCMRALASSKACVIDTYCLPVSILSHRKGLVIIQIWHALGAVKKFGYQCLDSQGGRSSSSAKALSMHKNYTYVTCASEATKSIYAEAFGTAPQSILVAGMPRLDYIVSDSAAKEKAKNDFYLKYPQLKNKTNILYAPTFRDDGKIQLDEIIKTVDFDKYNVIVKAHILSKDKPSDSRIIFSDDCIFDLFSVEDYVITDYSAVSFEAAAAGKKLFFYIYDIDEYSNSRGLNINPYTEYPEISFKSFAEIYTVIESGEYPYQALDSFRSKYTETDDGKCCERIVRLLTSAGDSL